MVRKAKLPDSEWSGLVWLAAFPREKAFAEKELGCDLLRSLVRKGIVSEVGGVVEATELGRALVWERANWE